jgi:hypothetical protein
MRLLSGVPHMEKHELSKIEFEIIDDRFEGPAAIASRSADSR